MTQTTAITEAAGPSARVPAPEAVPAEVAQRQLDSALAAELAVPASAGPDPLVPAPPRALPGILLLLFCLAVLLGVRLLSRGGLTRRRRPGPAYTDGEGGPCEGVPAGGAMRRPGSPHVREGIALPPHVAALIRRMDERQGGGAADADRSLEPGPPPSGLTSRPCAGGLDVWVGRERP